jgi:hypothetical protein
MTRAQIHLNKDNLEILCNCKSIKSDATIDQSTFNGLHSLQILWLSSNQITTIDQYTLNGLTTNIIFIQ